MKSSFLYRTHVAEAGLIWSILQTKGATTYSRPIGANGPSVALKAVELDLSEQQSPTHPARPGVPPDATRHCSTPCDRRLLRRRGRYPRHLRASSDYSNHLFDVPCPLPRRLSGCACRLLPRLCSLPQLVGESVSSLRLAQASTHVTGRRFGLSPYGDLCHEAPTWPVTRPSCSLATGPIDKSRLESSSTDGSRLRGARPKGDIVRYTRPRNRRPFSELPIRSDISATATADVSNETGPQGRKRNSLIEGDFDPGGCGQSGRALGQGSRRRPGTHTAAASAHRM
jgi:hypothetical protein